jgi:hypothetical protein
VKTISAPAAFAGNTPCIRTAMTGVRIIPTKSEVIQSKYFKAADYPDSFEEVVTIELARIEEIGQGQDKKEKSVVYFKRKKSGLVCGPVLWDQLIDATDEENSDDWRNHQVLLFRDFTFYAGKQVACLRIKKLTAPEKKPAAKKSAKKSKAADDDDEEFEVIEGKAPFSDELKF